MKSEQIENKRYKESEFGSIHIEEEMMFKMLQEYASSIKNNISILDIGCGSGQMALKIKKAGYQVKGLDFSNEALMYAKQKGIDTSQCNLDEGIPEQNSSYDIIWAGDIIEHVFDPMGLIKESARVLKPGGIMLITIPSDVGLISRIKILLGISYQEQMYRTSGYYKHHTFFTPSLIKFMLDSANLKIVKFKKILNIGKRYRIKLLPSLFFNEMIIKAQKNEKI